MPDTTLQVAPKTGTSLTTPTPDRSPVDCPNFTREEVKQFASRRARCRDLMGGTDTMWEKRTTYLPKWPGEDDETYNVRGQLTELYNAFERTVSAASGLVFAKEPELDDDAPEAVRQHVEDIDGQGTHLKVFLKNLFDGGLQDGLVGILVDYPKIDTTGLSRDDAVALNLRPRWVPYTCDQIINWRTMKVGGKIVLSLLTLVEEVDDDAGAFGVSCVTQYRVIRRAMLMTDVGVAVPSITFQIWRERQTADNKTEWYVYEDGSYRGVSGIPFAIGYLGRKTVTMQAMPPLSALAELNVGHYRVSADRRYLMSIVHSPTPVLEKWTESPRRADGQESADQGQMKVGPGAAMKLTGETTFRWEQADANGLTSSKEEKDDQKAEMASLSIAFLAQERKSAETATAHRINSVAQNATLTAAATGLEDCAEQALVFHCEYLKIAAADAPGLTIEVTYDEEKLDAQTIVALNQIAQAGNMTRRTLLTILQDGDIIPDTIDIDAEEALLDAQHREAQDAAAAAANRAHLLLASTLANAGKGDGAPGSGEPGPPASAAA